MERFCGEQNGVTKELHEKMGKVFRYFSLFYFVPSAQKKKYEMILLYVEKLTDYGIIKKSLW